MSKKKKESSTFAKRLLELRKKQGWSQPDLAEKIGTSGAIIGRYERGEMVPSIEVARKLARAFEVTLDFLVDGEGLPEALLDREMVQRWEGLQNLPEEERTRILFVVDALVRDARTREAYSRAG